MWCSPSLKYAASTKLFGRSNKKGCLRTFAIVQSFLMRMLSKEGFYFQKSERLLSKPPTHRENYHIVSGEVTFIISILSKKQLTLVCNFLEALGAKNTYTQKHSCHVSRVVEAILQRLPAPTRQLLQKRKLLIAALLHDIGKLNVPLEILDKAQNLTEEEWRIMHDHPRDGKVLLQGTGLEDIGDWILFHHERMDGRGYYKLEGKKIPIESRIIAIADTFSALRTHRVYRPAVSLEKTIAILKEMADTQLDGKILSCFLSIDTSVLEKLNCDYPPDILLKKYLRDFSANVLPSSLEITKDSPS